MDGYESWDEVRRSLPLNEARVAQYGRLGALEERLYEAACARRISAATLAETLGVDESDVWTIGGDDDLYLFALARHVAALGGHLEVRAVFDDEEVVLLREPEG